ncbi:unnamed protein product [Periconia digitata]|uniref:Uncharacterized protein n=1 Tax=Periconia digitata TaxID=1303443 RepID=A0A9W4U9R7_9PLEO|nr:unnamed protein product [Periconia digitata]
MYKSEVDLEVTCVVPNAPFRGSDPLENGTTTWYKTAGNCFVYGASLYPIAGAETIEDCGPVLETIEPEWHLPDPENSTVASTGTSWEGARPENETVESNPGSNDVEKRSSLERRWLWPTIIKEDYPVNCTTGSSFYNRWTNVTHVYHQNDTVNIQCAVKDYDDLSFTIMLFTTDFCYIRDYEVKPNLVSAITRSDRYPACGAYVDEVA